MKTALFVRPAQFIEAAQEALRDTVDKVEVEQVLDVIAKTAGAIDGDSRQPAKIITREAAGIIIDTAANYQDAGLLCKAIQTICIAATSDVCLHAQRVLIYSHTCVACAAQFYADVGESLVEHEKMWRWLVVGELTNPNRADAAPIWVRAWYARIKHRIDTPAVLEETLVILKMIQAAMQRVNKHPQWCSAIKEVLFSAIHAAIKTENPDISGLNKLAVMVYGEKCGSAFVSLKEHLRTVKDIELATYMWSIFRGTISQEIGVLK